MSIAETEFSVQSRAQGGGVSTARLAIVCSREPSGPDLFSSLTFRRGGQKIALPFLRRIDPITGQQIAIRFQQRGQVSTSAFAVKMRVIEQDDGTLFQGTNEVDTIIGLAKAFQVGEGALQTASLSWGPAAQPAAGLTAQVGTRGARRALTRVLTACGIR